MDHDQCRKRIGHLEDELDYHFSRKEELKRKVKHLEEDNDLLRKANFKNAQYQLQNESELNARIESLEKENDNLKTNLTSIEDIKSENMSLKQQIESMKEEEEKKKNDLRVANESHLVKMKNLLKCDECDDVFKDKAHMTNHILSNHLVREFKCNMCELSFSSEDDVKSHVKKQHSNKKQSNKLHKEYDHLISKLNRQKLKIYDDLLKLKEREEKENKKCNCKGTFCGINHSRFRWMKSKSVFLQKKLGPS